MSIHPSLTDKQWRFAMDHNKVIMYHDLPRTMMQPHVDVSIEGYLVYDDFSEGVGFASDLVQATQFYSESVTRWLLDLQIEGGVQWWTYSRNMGFFADWCLEAIIPQDVEWSEVFDTLVEDSIDDNPSADEYYYIKARNEFDKRQHVRGMSDDSYSTWVQTYTWPQESKHVQLRYINDQLPRDASIKQRLRLYRLVDPHGYKETVKEVRDAAKLLQLKETH